jgi:hypothetical protein
MIDTLLRLLILLLEALARCCRRWARRSADGDRRA